jgi:hypothetical protein
LEAEREILIGLLSTGAINFVNMVVSDSICLWLSRHFSENLFNDATETLVSAIFTIRVARDRTIPVSYRFLLHTCLEIVRLMCSEVIFFYYESVAHHWVGRFSVLASSATSFGRLVRAMGFMHTVAPVEELPKKNTDRRGRMVRGPNSYSEALGFKSRSGDRLSGMRIL